MNYIIRDEMSTRKQIFLPFVREVFCNKTKRNGILCNQRLQGIFGGPIGPSIFINNNLTLKIYCMSILSTGNHDCLLHLYSNSMVARQRLYSVYFSVHVYYITFRLFSARFRGHKTTWKIKK